MMIQEWNTKTVGKGDWRQVAGMLTARSNFATIVVQNIILVAGGMTAGDVLLSSVECFTPPAVADNWNLGQWTSIQPMPMPLISFAGVLSDETVLIFGTLIFSHGPSTAKT